MTKRILLASMTVAGFAALVWIMGGSIMFPSAHADGTHGAGSARYQFVGSKTGPYAYASASASSTAGFSIFSITPAVWTSPGHGDPKNVDVALDQTKTYEGLMDLTASTTKNGEPTQTIELDDQVIQIVVKGVLVQVVGPGKTFTIIVGVGGAIKGGIAGGVAGTPAGPGGIVVGAALGGAKGGAKGAAAGFVADQVIFHLSGKTPQWEVQGKIEEEQTLAPSIEGNRIWRPFGEGDSVGASGTGDFDGMSISVWDSDHGHDGSGSDDDDFGSRD